MSRNLIREAQAGSKQARASLISANMGVIHGVLKSFPALTLDQREEAQQEATFALARAIDRYDSRKGDFSAFAFTVVRRSVINLLKKPFHPTLSLEAMRQVGNEDAPAFDVVDVSATEAFEAVDLRDEVASRLSVLTEHERAIVKASYGLGCEPQSMRTIANDYGVSQQAVQQAHARALEKMRHDY